MQHGFGWKRGIDFLLKMPIAAAQATDLCPPRREIKWGALDISAL